MARRPGFTLVELLVCLALLAVLVAALLPALAAARSAALKVVCTSRLRDLTTAVNMHRVDKGVYPLQPGTSIDARYTLPAIGAMAISPPKPTDMDPAFLNVLQRYLPFPPLNTAQQVTADDLPHLVQCPTIEDADDEDRMSPADFTLARPALYTGYAYCVRPKDGSLVPGIKLHKPDRTASPVPGRDGPHVVVWADDVQWSMPDLAWRFAHPTPNARPGPQTLTYAEPRGLMGQHLAYSDGSVEWVNGSELDLDISGRGDDSGRTPSSSGSGRNGPSPSATPEDKASLSVFGMFFSWF